MGVVTLHPQERTPVPTEQRAWAIELVSTFCRRGKSLALAGSPAHSPVTMQTTLSWLLSIVDNICFILA